MSFEVQNNFLIESLKTELKKVTIRGGVGCVCRVPWTWRDTPHRNETPDEIKDLRVKALEPQDQRGSHSSQ